MEDEMVLDQSNAARAARLAASARGGHYAVWFAATVEQGGKRIGMTNLRRYFNPQVIENVTLNVGGPVDIRVRVKAGIPVLFVRSLFGADFREALANLHVVAKAGGVCLISRDSTQPAVEVMARMAAEVRA